MTQAENISQANESDSAPQANTPEQFQREISDRPEPLPVWLAWLLLALLVLGAVWAMYAYIVNYYVFE